MAIKIPEPVRVAITNEAGQVVEHFFESGVLTKVEDELKGLVEHLLHLGKAEVVPDPKPAAAPAAPAADATPPAPSVEAPAAPAEQGK